MRIHCFGIVFMLQLIPLIAVAQNVESTDRVAPLIRVIDLNVGDSRQVKLSDGSSATVKLLKLKETRDTVRDAVRRAEVTVSVNGKIVTLVSATYHLPTTVGSVQIDCSITKGYNSNGTRDSWNLEKDARLRLWPAGSPLLRPGTFMYPVKQRWFATHTQMANVPTFVDGGEVPSRKKIYYHNGLDIGGAEGMVDVVAATDGIVVSSGLTVLESEKKGTPVRPRYDVVYVRDQRGWYYRYSHLKEIDQSIKPGRIIKIGDPIGVLGKEGGSGGWSHLHFGISSKQPSGKWGTQAGYAFLWEAYLRQYKPKLIAVARPHHLVWVGEKAVLDATKSWSSNGKIAKYEWRFNDGSQADGPKVTRIYDKPGQYSEVLKVTDSQGNVDYDFAVVNVMSRERPDQMRLSIHPVYSPTFGIRAGDPVTFKVRTFGTTNTGSETWNFGDGSPPVQVRSDGNAKKLAKDGYAITTHQFKKPGQYVVRVERTNQGGVRAIGHVHVAVAAKLNKEGAKIVPVVQKYFASTSGKRNDLKKRLREYSGPIKPVIRKLIAAEKTKWGTETGTIKAQHFLMPELREKYPDELLYFYVPENYEPAKPFGLMIFMHGGGPGTKREYAGSMVSDLKEDRRSYGLQRYFRNSPFILVGPSALWNEKSSARWNLPETDDYINAVIRECHYRFNIDRDRVFLGGQSMGGFGAYHLCQRLGDRIAGGALYAGNWRVSLWQSAIGTPLFIRHGTNDAVAPGTPDKKARPRFTDVYYARSAHQLLQAAGAEHVYLEDDGCHSISQAGESVQKLVEWMKQQRRDPFTKRVVAITPRGWDAIRDTPTPHHRWVTIHQLGKDKLPFDEVRRTGPGPRWNETRDAFDQQGFQLSKRKIHAGVVDATNLGNNRLNIRTQNVKQFSVWLHPRMVDFSKPIQLTVNGAKSEQVVKPSLLTAIQSYERRGDWGLIYHAEIILDGDMGINH